MTDNPRDPGTDGRPPTPRWVKGLGVLLVIAALIVAVVLLQGGDQHGPSIHTGMGDHGDQPLRFPGVG